MINKNDIEFEYYKAAIGSGGQKVNKTSSSVRATHIPTGIVVTAHEGRSQTKNKELAINKIESKLKSLAEEKATKERQNAYNAKPETSFGSQLRTYRLTGKNQGGRRS